MWDPTATKENWMRDEKAERERERERERASRIEGEFAEWNKFSAFHFFRCCGEIRFTLCVMYVYIYVYLNVLVSHSGLYFIYILFCCPS